MNAKIPALSAIQQAFCEEYLKDLNATQAAIRAGYSKLSAKQHSQKLLTKPQIAALIAQLKAKRSERVQVDADYVLQRLVAIDQMDVADILDEDGDIRPVSEWPDTWRTSLSGMDVQELFETEGKKRRMTGLLKKIKWPDKVKNLELLGRHITVGAFKDSIDHNHKGEIRSITRTIVDPVSKRRAK